MLVNIQTKLEQLESFADLIKESVTALKQELKDGGASKSSARKGALPASERAKILSRRNANMNKKSHQ